MSGRKTTAVNQKSQPAVSVLPTLNFTQKMFFAPEEKERFTLEEAFDPDLRPPISGMHKMMRSGRFETSMDILRLGLFNAERQVRAIALLMDLESEEGNEPVGGHLTAALAALLQKCAGKIAWHVDREMRLSEEAARPSASAAREGRDAEAANG